MVAGRVRKMVTGNVARLGSNLGKRVLRGLLKAPTGPQSTAVTMRTCVCRVLKGFAHAYVSTKFSYG